MYDCVIMPHVYYVHTCTIMRYSLLILYIGTYRIGGVMVSVLASNVVDRGFEPR